MSWWDHIDFESEQRDWVPTISAIPDCMHLATADARAAVVIALETAGAEQDTLRLLKLLHFMDRLLFAQPALKEEDKDEFEDSKLDAVISARLHRFWRGDWQGLWADTLAAAKLRRRSLYVQPSWAKRLDRWQGGRKQRWALMCRPNSETFFPPTNQDSRLQGRMCHQSMPGLGNCWFRKSRRVSVGTRVFPAQGRTGPVSSSGALCATTKMEPKRRPYFLPSWPWASCPPRRLVRCLVVVCLPSRRKMAA